MDSLGIGAASAALSPVAITPGAEVAVPFSLDGREAHFKGTITKVMERQARVKFRDVGDSFTTYDVDHNRLFSFTPVNK